ncbi:MAG: DNA polymerase III subunit alpha, partial [Bacteroidales bacterium]|nr:DNA polymerase III subunit alpha [Bacteroidales bacterium]
YNEQLIVNKYLIEAAQRHNIKLIATNDIHFINAEDADAHDLLICLTTNSKLDDPKRMRYTGEEYFKSYEEMYELFGDVPQALSNTLEIADKVENFKLKSPAIMPFFEIPKEYASLEEYETKFDENSLITEFGKERYEGINGTYQDKLKIKLESDYLLHLTIKGAEERYPTPLSKEVLDRINFEIDTIKTMGFPGYFLIVQDFVRFARENGVLVGPGRGSAAGSIVSYCTGITDIDPLEFGLLFERFLNPDRISMPDVDIDFDDDGRQLVLNYVTEKYGQKNVAQIVTFGTMAAKSAIRDVARVLEVPLDEAMQLTKLLPEQNASLSNAYNLIMEGEKEHGSIEKYIAEINKEITHNITIGNDKPVPKLETRRVLAQEIIQARKIKNDKIIKTIQFACILEGSVRQTGVHACGVLIGRDGLINNIPLMPSKESKLLSTQYDGSLVESIGLLKMDFLGLKTLSIIKEALQNIKYGHNIDINLKEISFEDPKVYSLFSKGETTGLFQFESEGMKSHLKNLKPTEFGDLVAMNALYRPGPMEYIPDFIKRKNGFAEVSYDHPIMEEYLKPTYGITVYQEQVMLLSRALANFTRGESDSLRKAMGKKVISEMENLKSRFISGCNSNPKFIEGCNQINKNPDDVIEKIWKDWEAFANYAFNKSHSVCYAHLAYQTAYLKAYYPAEFMAACLSRNLSDIKEISKLMSECKRMKLKVLGPDVNASVAKFGVDSKGNIRFGLSAIKNVGSNAVRDIIEERQENGNYTDIFNFVERVNLSSVNKKNLEALAYSGALDEFEDIHRHQYFLSAQHENTSLIENLINYGNLMQSSSLSSHNLFGELLSVEAKKPDIPDPIPIVDTVWLNHEKTHIGLYIS